MAPSTPPPSDPSSSAAAAATSSPLITSSTTTTTRPIFPRPPNPQSFYSPPPSRLPSNPNPNYPQLAPRPPHPQSHDPAQLLYPVASSGRGFLSRPVAVPATRPILGPPFGFPYPDQGSGNQSSVRPTHLPAAFLGSGLGSVAPNATSGGLMPGIVKGIPVVSSHHLKACLPPQISDSNGHKDSRDNKRDDAYVVIRDRKVRVTDNASFYAICRSWLRNGFPQETQPQYTDVVKSLPRPLPVAAKALDSSDTKQDEEAEEKEDEESVEHLSTKELLQRHTSRAKRVRSRLRAERLERVTRYKTRLALLLPPVGDQHFKNEAAPAN